MNLLVHLQKQYDVSYLLIAHHVATTRYMANEVAVMYLGKIVEKAPTKELFNKPPDNVVIRGIPGFKPAVTQISLRGWL